MANQVRLKCLRCGYEYSPPPNVTPELEERTCPKCRSNSVRILTGEKKNV